MTILKVKLNGETDIVFIEDYDKFLEEVEGKKGIHELKVMFVGTFDPNPEQNEDVYTVLIEDGVWQESNLENKEVVVK